jgi:hypothetical protein
MRFISVLLLAALAGASASPAHSSPSTLTPGAIPNCEPTQGLDARAPASDSTLPSASASIALRLAAPWKRSPGDASATDTKPGNGPPTSKPGNGPPASKPGNGPPSDKPGNGPKKWGPPAWKRGSSTSTDTKPGNGPPASKPGNGPPASKPGNGPPTAKPSNGAVKPPAPLWKRDPAGGGDPGRNGAAPWQPAGNHKRERDPRKAHRRRDYSEPPSAPEDEHPEPAEDAASEAGQDAAKPGPGFGLGPIGALLGL